MRLANGGAVVLLRKGLSGSSLLFSRTAPKGKNKGEPMNELTKQEKEYFAMKGALQAIRNSPPEETADHMRLVARQTLALIEKPKGAPGRDCIICHKPVEADDAPAICSPECRETYRHWQEVDALEEKGGVW